MKNQPMTAVAFKRWLKHMDFDTHTEAARALGCSRTSLIKWTKEGAPFTVRLACAYLASMKDNPL